MTKSEIILIKLLLKYPDRWDSFKNNYPIRKTIKSLEVAGLLEVDDNEQFKSRIRLNRT